MRGTSRCLGFVVDFEDKSVEVDAAAAEAGADDVVAQVRSFLAGRERELSCQNGDCVVLVVTVVAAEFQRCCKSGGISP